jgi:glycosyltransferase involved in cell wall biosynthesis
MGQMAREAVSAIIPTYDRATLVGRAIDSALVALSDGDEIIVADDGSGDDTVAVVEAYGPPVRLLRLPHRGAGPARNAGLEAARGPLVAFLDSDDEWLPDKIDLQRTFMERRPDVLYTFSNFGVHLEDGSELPRYLAHWVYPRRSLSQIFGDGVPYSSVAPLPPGRSDFTVHIGSMYLEEMRNNLVTAFTIMFRKEGAGDALVFADDLPTAEEWQAFGRLAKRGPGAYFDVETAWQHGHAGPRLSGSRRHVLAEAWLKILDRVWGADREFVAEHGEDLRRARANAQLMRAVSLARHGRIRDAGTALRLAGAVTIAIRATEWLPGVFSGGRPT